MIAETRADGDLLFVACPSCSLEFEVPFTHFDLPRLERHVCGATVLFQADCETGKHAIEVVDEPEKAPALLHERITSRRTARQALGMAYFIGWKEKSDG